VVTTKVWACHSYSCSFQYLSFHLYWLLVIGESTTVPLHANLTLVFWCPINKRGPNRLSFGGPFCPLRFPPNPGNWHSLRLLIRQL
jgi:hypothetical protein